MEKAKGEYFWSLRRHKITVQTIGDIQIVEDYKNTRVINVFLSRLIKFYEYLQHKGVCLLMFVYFFVYSQVAFTFIQS